jgi:ATP-dependent Zn protease
VGKRTAKAKKRRANTKAYPVQRKQKALKRDIFLTAIHEAGHAVAFTVLGFRVLHAGVALERKSRHMLAAGIAYAPRPLPTRETIEREAICAMSGTVAEEYVGGSGYKTLFGHKGDRDAFSECAKRTGLSRNETNELINKAWQSAKQLVDKHRDAIKEVASELEKNGYIEGDAVRAIVEKGS